MNTKIFTTLPQDAKDIRIEVFMKEQGFENEFDEIDNLCHHIVAFDEGKPIGTCRVRVSSFYEKQGYIQFGQIDDDEGVPHMWMKKKIQY